LLGWAVEWAQMQVLSLLAVVEELEAEPLEAEPLAKR